MRPLPPSPSAPDRRAEAAGHAIRPRPPSRVSDAVAREQLLRDARRPTAWRRGCGLRAAACGRAGRSRRRTSVHRPSADGGARRRDRNAGASGAPARRRARRARARERAQRVERVVGDEPLPDEIPERVDGFGRDSRRRPRRGAAEERRAVRAQVVEDRGFAFASRRRPAPPAPRPSDVATAVGRRLAAAAAAADDRRDTARCGRRARRAARRRPRRPRRPPSPRRDRPDRSRRSARGRISVSRIDAGSGAPCSCSIASSSASAPCRRLTTPCHVVAKRPSTA